MQESWILVVAPLDGFGRRIFLMLSAECAVDDALDFVETLLKLEQTWQLCAR
ncbi:hypothetical protein NEOLEDRAFT_736836 [Neolentinus lepideus HHB14362 ss-1]|uniref:Uncharacterized protein n=1 Tax=Neolentinus lepideus HHB14362 ss-1 TaxID=1314782 RepID=A0A165PZE8_9AGAM|nr:hypothetical protein NEOLEDRAFT_736836 [Neolentinus lepideus HHB14362 ss-1]